MQKAQAGKDPAAAPNMEVSGRILVGVLQKLKHTFLFCR